MRLEGSPEGIAALKEMREKDMDALKFLIAEARTNTDHRARFRTADGRTFTLSVNPRTGDLTVEPAE